MTYQPLKESTRQEYLQIWSFYVIGNQSQVNLAKQFGCSEDKIASAIKWVAENKAQFKTGVLAEIAKETIEGKVRELSNDLVRIKEKEPVNWNAVIGVERLIMDNRGILWKLQAVIQDKSMVIVNNIIENNQVLKARDEMVEGMSNDERQQVLSRIREIIDRPSDIQEETNGIGMVGGTSSV